MALSDEQRKEVLDLMSEAVASGLERFRSALEEREAKSKPKEEEEPSNDNGNDFSFAEWFLGR